MKIEIKVTNYSERETKEKIQTHAPKTKKKRKKEKVQLQNVMQRGCLEKPLHSQ